MRKLSTKRSGPQGVKKEYEKFFEMWKDADKNLPALVKAKKEFEELFEK